MGGDTRHSVLLTGATGQIGSALLRALLTDSDRRVICPVRAATHAEARARGEVELTRLFGPRARNHTDRVDWLQGDLRAPRLGWGADLFDQVAGRIREVFHCGGSHRIDTGQDAIDDINVAGTARVFALAEAAQRTHGAFLRFHHMSTAYVNGAAVGTVTASDLPDDGPKAFRNSYERSKARAERWLADNAGGIAVSIHRPSMVAGDSRNGVTERWEGVYVPMRLLVHGRLARFPSVGGALADTVGPDFVADAVLAFAAIDTKAFHRHHLTAGSAFSVDELLQVATQRARDFGYTPSTPERVKPAGSSKPTGLRRLTGRSSRSAPSQSGDPALEAYLPYATSRVVFDTMLDHGLLLPLGASMPLGSTYLRTIVDRALATDFGERYAAAVGVDIDLRDEVDPLVAMGLADLR